MAKNRGQNKRQQKKAFVVKNNNSDGMYRTPFEQASGASFHNMNSKRNLYQVGGIPEELNFEDFFTFIGDILVDIIDDKANESLSDD